MGLVEAVDSSTPRSWSSRMFVQLAIKRSARRTSPGASTSHNRRSKLTSPCPLPAYRQNPRFTMAAHDNEVIAPMRADRESETRLLVVDLRIGGLVFGRCL